MTANQPTETRIARCSGTPRFLACADSVLDDGGPMNDPNNPEAWLGTAGHKVVAHVPMGTDPDINAIAAEYGADAAELWPLYAFAKQAWDALGKWMPNPSVEQHLEAQLSKTLTMRGTPDVYSVSYIGEALASMAVLDWKTGWGDIDHIEQLMSYALLLVERHGMPSSGHVLLAETHLRFRSRTVTHATEDDLEGHKQRLIKQARSEEHTSELQSR